MNNNSKYYNTFVALYNESVKHDNTLGKCDHSWANKLARTWASINLKNKKAIEKFMYEWDEFYNHMFD